MQHRNLPHPQLLPPRLRKISSDSSGSNSKSKKELEQQGAHQKRLSPPRISWPRIKSSPSSVTGRKTIEEDGPLEGFLEKKGKNINSNWKQRYFKLDGEYLLYCSKDKEKGRINCDDANFGIETSGVENEFQIKTDERIFFLRASSKEDKDMWINGLMRFQNRGSKSSKKNDQLTPKKIGKRRVTDPNSLKSVQVETEVKSIEEVSKPPFLNPLSLSTRKKISLKSEKKSHTHSPPNKQIQTTISSTTSTTTNISTTGTENTSNLREINKSNPIITTMETKNVLPSKADHSFDKDEKKIQVVRIPKRSRKRVGRKRKKTSKVIVIIEFAKRWPPVIIFANAICYLLLAWMFAWPFTGSIVMAILVSIISGHYVPFAVRDWLNEKKDINQPEKSTLNSRSKLISTVGSAKPAELVSASSDDEEETDTNSFSPGKLVRKQSVALFNLLDQSKLPDGLPIRYLEAEENDVELAIERWNATNEWREENGVNDILSQPHPHFQLMKDHIRHFFHGRDKHGHPVYYERPGLIDVGKLKEKGLTDEDLTNHYIFNNEYVWKHISPDVDQENWSKSITVLDMKGIGYRDVYGDGMKLVQSVTKIMQTHYPGRSCKIIIINVPRMFSVIWTAISATLSQRSRDKTFICRGDYTETMEKWIDPANIPVEYGGTCDCNGLGCEKNSEMEKNMRSFVNQLNQSTE